MTHQTWPTRWVGSPLRAAAILVVWSLAAALSLAWLPGHDAHTSLTGTVVVAAAVGSTILFLLHPRLREWSIGGVALLLLPAVIMPTAIRSLPVIFSVCYVAWLIGRRSSSRTRWMWALALAAGIVPAMRVNEAVMRGLIPVTGLHNPFAGYDGLMIGTLTIPACWAFVGVFFLLGLQRRNKVRTLALLRERVENASSLERTRIAREMHDIIAHSLSGIIAQADGARYAAAASPAVAITALEAVSGTARESLGQLNGLLHTLREEPGRDLDLPPSTSDFRALAEHAEAEGIEFRWPDDNIPADLSPLAQFTFYRVLQEIISNIMLHATPRSGSVTVTSTGRSIRIDSANLVSGQRRRAPGGFGLVGIDERVQAAGGSASWSLIDGQFSLSVEIPR